MSPSDLYRRDQLLADLSSFHIGGAAAYYAQVKSVEEAQHALAFCQEHDLPFFVLGKGSNSLFDDRGFAGMVIHCKLDFCRESAPGHFHCGAGHSFARLGCMTARKGWTGLEFASGIPGTVGGAVYMNAGANGGETADCLQEVEFLTCTGKVERRLREQLRFGNRYSSFQDEDGVILSATFVLTPSEEAGKKQREIAAYRQATQPLTEWSAGCVFRNPSGKSAGALIDACGLKGKRIGGAMVSPVHANFIVNAGGATSRDVEELATLMRDQVKAQTGEELEMEVRKVPFEA